MIEIILQRNTVALQSLVRGEVVGIHLYKTQPEEKGDQFPLSGPFWYYQGEVKHQHRDGTLTIHFRDCRGWNPETLRFDTTFHAERSGNRLSGQTRHGVRIST